MTVIWLNRMTTAALLALGLAGCVAYEPAPYYGPAPAYYGPAPGPSVNFVFRDGDHDWHHGHEHWH